MKNIFLAILILTTGFLTTYGQDQNNENSDDVYYNSDNNAGPAPADQSNNQYDDENQTDAGAPTYQTFYDQLNPYGTWINSPTYGYVWMPNQVPGDFSPYLTGGNWAYTDYGWTWVSDYAWGWGPFHYGNWVLDPTYGWIWIPGYDWAPAWVVWGDYGGYYCWAPIGYGGIVSAHYRPDYHSWHFIPHEHMGGDPGRYVVDSRTFAANNHFDVAQINDHVNVLNHASTYKQSVFFSGPKAAEVEKYTGQKVNKVAVTDAGKAAPSKLNGGHVEMYRPGISRTNKQPAPSKVSRPEDVHPVTRPQASQPAQQRNAAPKQAPEQKAQPSWTPPRQSTPRQAQPEHNFVPTERPAYSAPSRPSFNGGGGGGGGMRGGGGGGGRH